ncbi:universal stress protein [Haloferacaceae archaeon DSL9]
MYQIVLGVDDDESRARTVADAIADLPVESDAVRVAVLYCFEDNPAGASAPQVAAVRRVSERLADRGIDAEIHEDSGDPAEAIFRLADSLDAALIAIGKRRRSPAGKALFGSVTQDVILQSERPVLVVGSD